MKDEGAHFDAEVSPGVIESVRAAHFDPVVLAPGAMCTMRGDEDRWMVVAARKSGDGDRFVQLRSVATSVDRDVAERDLDGLEPPSSPVDALASYAGVPSGLFLLCERFVDASRAALASCDGLEAIAGARIHFYEHQIAAARKVLSTEGPRALLGDEVGLGKTIECAIVISVLLAQAPNLRVLVVAPATLTRQWQRDLLSKFGLVFRGIEQHDDGSTAQRIVMSYRDFVVASSNATQMDGAWDVIVVDEAHRIPTSSSLYDLLHRLTNRVRGLLLLSATPVRTRPAEFVRLLSLLNPSAFAPTDVARLEQLRPFQRQLEELFGETDGCTRFVMKRRAASWIELLPKDAVILQLAERMTGDVEPERARDELLRYVADAYRIDDRIIRNRRERVGATLNLPQRTHARITYEASEAERHAHALLARWCRLSWQPEHRPALRMIFSDAWQRACSSAAAFSQLLQRRRDALRRLNGRRNLDLMSRVPMSSNELSVELFQLLSSVPTVAGELALLDELQHVTQRWQQDERRPHTLARVLLQRLDAQQPQKFLVFATYRESLDSLARALAGPLQRQSLHFLQFHAELPQDARDRAASAFLGRRDCCALLCDETGGEGLNFQAANYVMHFDTPWDLGAVEQRIGRLDRLGRSGAVHSLSLESDGLDRTWGEVAWKAFDIGNRTLAGLEFLAEEVCAEFCDRATTGNMDAIVDVVTTVPNRVARERRDLAADEERRLDSVRFDANDVRDIIAHLESSSAPELSLAKECLEAAGISYRVTPDGVIRVDARERQDVPRHIRRAFAATVDRRRALAQTDLEYLGWNHHLVKWLLDLVTRPSSRAAAVNIRCPREAWNGVRSSVSVEPDPRMLRHVPPHLRAIVNTIAPRAEHRIYVRGDGVVEGDVHLTRSIEILLGTGRPIDCAARALDAEASRRWRDQLNALAAHAADHALSIAKPFFEKLATQLEQQFAIASASAAAVAAWRQQATDAGQQDVYRQAVDAVRNPRATLDSIVWIELEQDRQ